MNADQLISQYPYKEDATGNEYYDLLEAMIPQLNAEWAPEEQEKVSEHLFLLIEGYNKKSQSPTRGKKVRMFLEKTSGLQMSDSVKKYREALLQSIEAKEAQNMSESRFAREVEAVNNSLSDSMEELEAAIEKTIIEQSSPEEIKKKILHKEIIGSVLIVVGVLFIGWLIVNIELIPFLRVAAVVLPITGIAVPVYYFRAVKAVHRGNPEIMSIIHRSQWLWALISVVLFVLSIVLAVIIL